MKASGRAGLRLPLSEGQGAFLDPRSSRSLLARRDYFKPVLQSLLVEKPLELISVDDVLVKANRARDTFYAAFHSGMPGLYCYWATEQLDLLTGLIEQRAIHSTSGSDRVDSALRIWADIASHFVMELPYGRLPIVLYLVYEIDHHGTALTYQLESDHSDRRTSREKEEAALEEFVGLAADLHRSGARLISTLTEILKTAEGLMAHRWKGSSEDAVWNYAVSFWQTVFMSQFAVGIMESEDELRHHQAFTVDVWLRGALRHGQRE